MITMSTNIQQVQDIIDSFTGTPQGLLENVKTDFTD